MDIVILGVAVVLYFVLHSVFAANRVKSKLYPYIPKQYYRLFYNFQSVFLLIAIAYYYIEMSSSYVFPPYKLVGSVLAGVGVVFILLALKQYNLSEFSGTYQLNNQGNVPSTGLHTSGLNRYVRHPLYTASYMIFIGAVLFSPTLKAIVVISIACLYIVIGTKLEEIKLVEEFGQEYVEYQKRVGMFLPRV